MENDSLHDFPVTVKLIHIVADPCLKVKCEFNGKCYRRADRASECVCPICDSGSKMQAICGSDGKTYASYCHLKSASCTMKEGITVMKDEPCGKYEGLTKIH